MTQPPIDEGSQPAQQPEQGQQPAAAQPGQQPGHGGPYQAAAPHPPVPPYPPPYQPGTPYPQGAPYQPYPPGMVYAPPFNTYAILSLVMSVAVFPPLGIYFGYKAKEQIARTGERGVELATVGVILGWVFTAIIGVLILLWCAMAVTMFGGVAAAGTTG